MRSRKAKFNQAASIIGTLAALAFSLLVALGLGILAYAITSEAAVTHVQHATSRGIADVPPANFILFMIFSFLYMLWATLPLSIGGGSQFDPGRLLMYPISLRKLFVIDFASELTSLSSIFAIPAILAIAIGTALSTGATTRAMIAAVVAVLLGISLAKWLATSIGSLVRKRRTRGETLLALIGALAGLSGAFMGQLWPIVVRHSEWFRALRWTPPGAAAVALSDGLADSGQYAIALLVLTGYTVTFIFGAYWIAERSVLGRGDGGRRKLRPAIAYETYTGWRLPVIAADLSALIEKELRYAIRNAQLRMLALMPLILLAVRFMNGRRLSTSSAVTPGSSERINELLHYGGALMATAGVLYVFLILSGLACNSFAFDGGGMRTLILSPVERRKILFAKNLVITIVAFVFSAALLIVNELVFRDLTFPSLLFVFLSFIIFATITSMTGNWFSIRFPKRMRFGKRMNVSGLAGLLLLPIALLMALPPLVAIAAGYMARSSLVEYATLALLAAAGLLLYLPVLKFQGRSLERHERDILEAVSMDLEG